MKKSGDMGKVYRRSLIQEAKKYKSVEDFIKTELPLEIAENKAYGQVDVKDFMKSVKIESISGTNVGNIFYKGENLGKVVTKYYGGKKRPNYAIAGDLKTKLTNIWKQAR